MRTDIDPAAPLPGIYPSTLWRGLAVFAIPSEVKYITPPWRTIGIEINPHAQLMSRSGRIGDAEIPYTGFQTLISLGGEKQSG